MTIEYNIDNGNSEPELFSRQFFVCDFQLDGCTVSVNRDELFTASSPAGAARKAAVILLRRFGTQNDVKIKAIIAIKEFPDGRKEFPYSICCSKVENATFPYTTTVKSIRNREDDRVDR